MEKHGSVNKEKGRNVELDFMGFQQGLRRVRKRGGKEFSRRGFQGRCLEYGMLRSEDIQGGEGEGKKSYDKIQKISPNPKLKFLQKWVSLKILRNSNLFWQNR